MLRVAAMVGGEQAPDADRLPELAFLVAANVGIVAPVRLLEGSCQSDALPLPYIERKHFSTASREAFAATGS